MVGQLPIKGRNMVITWQTHLLKIQSTRLVTFWIFSALFWFFSTLISAFSAAHLNHRDIYNYLDITLNWNDGSYRPYRKPNEETNYIHISSNHPPSIIKEIAWSVEKRLSILSSSKDIFQESAIFYEKCLKNSGYKTKLQYQHPKENNQNKKKRKPKIIWLNPPYSKSVKTNIGKIFIKLICKHFPPNHKFVKIFNKNTIKLSYSCMPNIRSKINSHNKKYCNPSPQSHRNYATAFLKKIAHWMDYV